MIDKNTLIVGILWFVFTILFLTCFAYSHIVFKILPLPKKFLVFIPIPLMNIITLIISKLVPGNSFIVKMIFLYIVVIADLVFLCKEIKKDKQSGETE